MLPVSSYLVTASAAIILFLGSAHMLFTFVGNKLHPRDAKLIPAMQAATMRLTKETDMWRAWIGFNATHSLAAIQFGCIYAYLALFEPTFLLSSPFFLAFGSLVLISFTIIGSLYFFSTPNRGIRIATALYTLALFLK